METGMTGRGTGIMENNAAVKMRLTGRPRPKSGSWKSSSAPAGFGC